MRKLSIFLLLPLMSIPFRFTADLRNRIAERGPWDLTRGDLTAFITQFAQECFQAPRRLLTHSATAQEIQVIAAKADAEATTTAKPPARRRVAHRVTRRVLPAAPRVHPQTT